jgi:hypothetical protein
MEPYLSAFWRQSVRAGNTQFKRYDSEFGSQDKVHPQSSAGVTVGAEIIPWERKAKSQKVSVLVETNAVLHYGGRAYSEIWELLADSPALAGTYAPGRDTCDTSGVVAYANGAQDPSNYFEQPAFIGCERFNGITTVQDYASFGLDTMLSFHLGTYARMLIGSRFSTDTRHFLTFASRGDPDREAGGDPDRVDPDTAEVNPVRRDVVDNVGRRYAIDDVFDFMAYARFLVTF